MIEVWKDIPDFPGYQVSNTGKVRSFWHKQRKFGTHGGTERVLIDTPYELSQSDDGNGYMKVFLQNDYCRRCVKVHRLVAEAFIQRESDELDTVDHRKSGRLGKLDNRVTNLRWMTRRKNIQKAYRDGICEERIKNQEKSVLVTDLWTNQLIYFNSLHEAADFIGRHYTTLSKVMGTGKVIANRFLVDHLDGPDKLLYDGGDFDVCYYN